MTWTFASRFLFGFASLAFCTICNGQEDLRYKVMSFNVRYGTANDGENHWNNRKRLVADVIHRHEPDLLGLQECLRFQLDFLLGECETYDYVGVGRDDGKDAGEFVPVLFRKDRFEKISGRTLWLSGTPQIAGSITWGNALPRTVTFVLLKDKVSGREFLFASTHFSHVSENHRRRSADFLEDRLRSEARGRPILLVGDFNASTDSMPYRKLVGDPVSGVEGTFVDTFMAATEEQKKRTGTFNGFTDTPKSSARIDWVLCSAHFVPTACTILRDQKDGRTPSDHYPVFAVVTLR